VVERALIEEYVAALASATAHLRPDNRAAVIALAELPEMVRGYEDVKLRNAERFRAELERHRNASTIGW
jgi:indolepyruvate ferredoxin oxidoreductase